MGPWLFEVCGCCGVDRGLLTSGVPGVAEKFWKGENGVDEEVGDMSAGVAGSEGEGGTEEEVIGGVVGGGELGEEWKECP